MDEFEGTNYKRSLVDDFYHVCNVYEAKTQGPWAVSPIRGQSEN